jgi:CheY-like chemotaxis protein
VSPNSSRSILLAEDSPEDVELTLRVLQKNNIANQVVVAQDGAEALDYLYREGEFAGREGGNPAVILLDLKMPKVDGLEVLSRIKSDEKLKTIPVVILTSSREECDIVEGYRLGVNGYVVKPVHFSEFMEAVKHLGLYWLLVNQPPPDSTASNA